MSNVTALRKERPVPIGTLIDQMWDNREQRRALETQIKELNESYDALEAKLIKQMETQGVDKSTGKKGSAGLGSSTRPNIVDDDAFYNFVFKNKYRHLLERRPSVSGCNELLALKGTVPGIEFFTKTKVNLTTVK